MPIDRSESKSRTLSVWITILLDSDLEGMKHRLGDTLTIF